MAPKTKAGRKVKKTASNAELQRAPSKTALQKAPLKPKLKNTPLKPELQTVPLKPGLKNAPLEADAKEKAMPEREESPPVDPAILSKHKKMYAICSITAAISIAIIAVMTDKYLVLKERWKQIDPLFQRLRQSLKTSLDKPELEDANPKQIAEEVKKLPGKIKASESSYAEQKNQYRFLWYKANKGSSWQSRGKNSYYFSKGEKTWYEAEDFCRSRGTHLASVLSYEEQDFIVSHLQHASWIGLTTGNKEGSWRWSDGSRLEKKDWFGNLASHERGLWKSKQDCAVIEPSLINRTWKVNNCHKLHRWVCKENLNLEEQLRQLN